MARQIKGKRLAAQREKLVEIIRSKAMSIDRPNLQEVKAEDVGRIQMLPMDRISCIARGVPLYVNKDKTIQVADSGMPMGGGNGCKVKMGGLRKFQDN